MWKVLLLLQGVSTPRDTEFFFVSPEDASIYAETLLQSTAVGGETEYIEGAETKTRRAKMGILIMALANATKSYSIINSIPIRWPRRCGSVVAVKHHPQDT